MPSPRERHRNNIRMGVFVSVALLVALYVVVMLTGAVERFTVRTDRYIVEFSLRAGVRNIEKGSAVRVGGVKLGEVVEVNPVYTEPFETIEVVFALDEKVKLYSDADVFVSAPLIAAEAWLDIPHVGTVDAGRPVDGRLRGSERAGMITTMLGPENAERTDQILENVRLFSEVFARVPDDYEAIIGNVKQATGDARDLVARISHEDWPQWSESVTRVAQWAADATHTLERVLDQANGLLEDTRGIVGENRASIERIVSNIERTTDDVRDLMGWINEDGRERIVRILDNGGDALGEARSVLGRLNREHFDRWATDLGFMMANANHASQQLKLAMTEVRRAPWKALHIPSAQEVEHEYLYEAMRQFALAASDLKSASVAAQRILDNHHQALAGDEQAMDRLTRNLMNYLDTYERAQQRLMDVLISE